MSRLSTSGVRLPARIRLLFAYVYIIQWVIGVAERVQVRLFEIARRPIQDSAQIALVFCCFCWVVPLLVRGPEYLASSNYLRQLEILPGYAAVTAFFIAVGILNLVALFMVGVPEEPQRIFTVPIVFRLACFFLGGSLFVLLGIIQTFAGLSTGTFLWTGVGAAQFVAGSQMVLAVNVRMYMPLMAKEDEKRRRSSSGSGSSGSAAGASVPSVASPDRLPV